MLTSAEFADPRQASGCWASQRIVGFSRGLLRRPELIMPVSVRGLAEGLHNQYLEINKDFFGL